MGEEAIRAGGVKEPDVTAGRRVGLSRGEGTVLAQPAMATLTPPPPPLPPRDSDPSKAQPDESFSAVCRGKKLRDWGAEEHSGGWGFQRRDPGKEPGVVVRFQAAASPGANGHLQPAGSNGEADCLQPVQGDAEELQNCPDVEILFLGQM